MTALPLISFIQNTHILIQLSKCFDSGKGIAKLLGSIIPAIGKTLLIVNEYTGILSNKINTCDFDVR